jgi:hypothetical protein
MGSINRRTVKVLAANAPGSAQAVPAIKGPAPLFAGEDP